MKSQTVLVIIIVLAIAVVVLLSPSSYQWPITGILLLVALEVRTLRERIKRLEKETEKIRIKIGY